MVVYPSIRPFVMLHRMGKGRKAGSIVSAAGADHTTAGSINGGGLALAMLVLVVLLALCNMQ